MGEIFHDEQTSVWCENACLMVDQNGVITRIEASQLETVAELTPCTTFGKWTDFHTIAIRAKDGRTVYVPTTKDAARRMLAALQQFRLNSARQLSAGS